MLWTTNGKIRNCNEMLATSDVMLTAEVGIKNDTEVPTTISNDEMVYGRMMSRANSDSNTKRLPGRSFGIL